MAVNSISSASTLNLQATNAVNERRLEEQRAQRVQDQQQREQQVQRAEREQQQTQETRRSDEARQAEQQDFLTLQQLRAEAANQNRPSRGTPAPGSNINVTA